MDSATSIKTRIHELQQFIPFVFCDLVLHQSKLAFKNFSNSFRLFSAALSSFVFSSFNRIFLPETALRRTPSSLSCPKNFESRTGLLFLSICCFYIAPITRKKGRTNPETSSTQENQAPSHHVTDPSSNFKEPIHKTGRKYYKHIDQCI